MQTIQRELNVKIGYSDHTLGIEIPIAAAALGAVVIEKHFTLDRDMEGPDHRASLEPGELSNMIRAIRNVELAISGTGIKSPSESEKKNIEVARKSMHYVRDLKKDDVLTENDLVMLRPGSGVSPMEIDQVLGKQIRKSVSQGDQFSWKDIQ
jgi:sialic acid synthase SpsE